MHNEEDKDAARAGALAALADEIGRRAVLAAEACVDSTKELRELAWNSAALVEAIEGLAFEINTLALDAAMGACAEDGGSQGLPALRGGLRQLARKSNLLARRANRRMTGMLLAAEDGARSAALMSALIRELSAQMRTAVAVATRATGAPSRPD